MSYGRCRELAQQQTELARECAQTVLLIREDGTSSAILLAVEDIESDMNSVADWMQQSNVSELTVSVQRDILESLKQLIETMQREMQQMQDQQQQDQQQQNQQQQQQSPLVDLIAEIRVLKNLQLQVNRRTKQVDGLLDGAEGAERVALQKQVSELAVRQQKLFESAKDLEKQGRKGAGGDGDAGARATPGAEGVPGAAGRGQDDDRFVEVARRARRTAGDAARIARDRAVRG